MKEWTDETTVTTPKRGIYSMNVKGNGAEMQLQLVAAQKEKEASNRNPQLYNME